MLLMVYTAASIAFIYTQISHINAIEAAVNTTDSMAPSALPFEPSYTALKNLHQKIYDCTTTSVTLPIRPENLATDLRPYLDNAIVTLSTSTAYLYDMTDWPSPLALTIRLKKSHIAWMNA
ncbi:uncharacterized protein K441DRAFT_56358 [Cenococcum geophilum 1.58]|uniref:uncharacterized protein n=1 Tax=Cenococcum geophilum 1.58 TaxID=794803 RepID=UPI00358E8C29|nr:hypothetical protein K441DRAFT_56358 [Cenococcum geophilum 1.58]